MSDLSLMLVIITAMHACSDTFFPNIWQQPAATDEDKTTPWESYHERHLNTDFAMDKNSLSDPVSGVHR